MWVEQLLVFMSGDFNSDAGVGNRAIRYTRCSLMDRPGSEQMNSNKKPVRTTTIRSTYRSHKQLTVLCSSTNYPSLVSERLWTYEGESTSSRCGWRPSLSVLFLWDIAANLYFKLCHLEQQLWRKNLSWLHSQTRRICRGRTHGKKTYCSSFINNNLS